MPFAAGAAIDVLFTGVVMPGNLQSVELARKARLKTPGIAVLFTSGYAEGALGHSGRLDVGTDLLSKPYSRDELALELRQGCENPHRKRPRLPVIAQTEFFSV
jgi:DNA-binding LytR/AlgR family response regulator